MNLGNSFKLAIKSLLTSKMRALLTMLGIIIGVGAVIVITSMGNGMQTMMNEQFDKMGANLVQVQVWGRGGAGGELDSRRATAEDMYELVDKYPQYLTGVTPYVGGQVKVRAGNDDYDKTSVYGVGESFMNDRGNLMTGEVMETGRFLQYVDVDRRQNVCVIGSYLAKTAFKGDAVGKTINVGGTPCTVIGVLAKNADETEGSGDDQIFVPYTFFGNDISMFMLTTTSKDTAAVAKGIVEHKLMNIYQTSDAYMVITSAEMMDSMNMMVNVMMVVLVAIAAISLLVGGIGIMNIMLVSVTERTREIGIRKSLGAKGRDIRMQFIIEAGTTSAIGGVLGILVGVGLAQVAGMIIGSMMTSMMGGGTFSAVPQLSSIAMAFGISVGIGIFFGYLPANKAAKLNPIDALRYE